MPCILVNVNCISTRTRRTYNREVVFNKMFTLLTLLAQKSKMCLDLRQYTPPFFPNLCQFRIIGQFDIY